MLKAYKYYWENAFKYQATSTRADYWWAVLMNVIIYAILWLLLAASGVSSIGSLVNGTTQGLGMVLIIVVIMGVFGFANIFPAISITVRRLRDVGLSGWFLFAVWLFSVVLGNVDNAFFEGLMAALEIRFCGENLYILHLTFMHSRRMIATIRREHLPHTHRLSTGYPV